MTIAKITIHGFETPFVYNAKQSIREWNEVMKPVKAERQRLRILAQQLVAQQNGMNEVSRQPITSEIEQERVDPSYLASPENSPSEDANWLPDYDRDAFFKIENLSWDDSYFD